MRIVRLSALWGLLCCAQSLSAQTWDTDYDLAVRLSERTGKPLLIDFYATWCGPCKQMERTTFRDTAVRKLMAKCICLRIDVDQSPALAKRFEVKSIPRLIVLDSKGRRLMDALGYRPPEAFRQDLVDALRGKPVIDGGAPSPPSEPQEIATLRTMAETGRYALWKSRNPSLAARARVLLVERLGAFEASERSRAAALLMTLGEDAAPALIAALNHPLLAVRVASYDALTRLLQTRYSLPPAAQPRYDAWAAAPERARQARVWAQWWTQRRRPGAPSAL